MQVKQKYFKLVQKASVFLMFSAPCSLAFKAHFWACRKLNRQQLIEAVIL